MKNGNRFECPIPTCGEVYSLSKYAEVQLSLGNSLIYTCVTCKARIFLDAKKYLDNKSKTFWKKENKREKK